MDNKEIKFPKNLVSPIKELLKNELIVLKKRRKQIKNSDPFKDESRTLDNSLEEDLDEQLDHFNSEVKANFLTKRIIELRKALTRIKIGKYGICEICGKMIDTNRLAVKPETTVCIKCEKEREA
jgi:DnaK suppressor protein